MHEDAKSLLRPPITVRRKPLTDAANAAPDGGSPETKGNDRLVGLQNSGEAGWERQAILAVLFVFSRSLTLLDA
ncbi:hypothetical protein [Phaeovulum vinaykumarii]|uniref:hypothetical protein n=1 Tax=Phaeovulum vinaykumarii TaxID=407234 RepID=UPI00117B91DD|nr:hypothetical protein [Phaeovulum vinaykumarii]